MKGGSIDEEREELVTRISARLNKTGKGKRNRRLKRTGCRERG